MCVTPAAKWVLAMRSDGWGFLTNPAHTLLCVSESPDIRFREIAQRVGITPRAVQGIVAELEQAGYLSRERVGRCNRYEVNPQLPLRHDLEDHLDIGALLRVLAHPHRADE